MRHKAEAFGLHLLYTDGLVKAIFVINTRNQKNSFGVISKLIFIIKKFNERNVPDSAFLIYLHENTSNICSDKLFFL
jgi:hypothetical protein